ncbi:MAG: YggT family protein [Propionibacterium sp.]|nr:YggT family protein [Propionibacterium sp.]
MWVTSLYMWVLLGRVVLSFVPLLVPGWTPRGLMLVIVEGIYTLTDPPINLLRKVLPALKLGNVALDISVIVLLFAIQIFQGLLAFVPF